ncbi:MAG: site-2 protease family protein [Bdellovibrionales bacterium]|nr:site-2 protease family protein [Bdellovibrionales bacterium]
MNINNLTEIGFKLAIMYVPFLFALCFHEFAHGYVAKMKGDNTAQLMGRLTLNPLAHMDFIGTFLLPVFAIVTGIPYFFGWAKPVPVNPRNLSNEKNDMFWIALAGPLSNVFLAVVAVGIMFLFKGADVETRSMVNNFMSFFFVINLFLAVFNMLPLHPLDGGKVIARFLPYKTNRWLEENSQVLNFALIILILSGGFRIISGPVLGFSYKVFALVGAA